jgi:hypothetical protein
MLTVTLKLLTLSVILLNVIMLSVIILSVMALEGKAMGRHFSFLNNCKISTVKCFIVHSTGLLAKFYSFCQNCTIYEYCWCSIIRAKCILSNYYWGVIHWNLCKKRHLLDSSMGQTQLILANRGARQLMGENPEVVWPSFPL